MKIDFSVFHPIDHWIWEKRCREFHGGWWTHLAYSWEYRRKEEVLWWPRRLLLCPFGRHRFTVSSRQDEQGDVWVHASCNECHLGRAVTDEEYDRAKDFWAHFSSRRHPEAGAS